MNKSAIVGASRKLRNLTFLQGRAKEITASFASRRPVAGEEGQMGNTKSVATGPHTGEVLAFIAPWAQPKGPPARRAVFVQLVAWSLVSFRQAPASAKVAARARIGLYVRVLRAINAASKAMGRL